MKPVTKCEASVPQWQLTCNYKSFTSKCFQVELAGYKQELYIMKSIKLHDKKCLISFSLRSIEKHETYQLNCHIFICVQIFSLKKDKKQESQTLSVNVSKAQNWEVSVFAKNYNHIKHKWDSAMAIYFRNQIMLLAKELIDIVAIRLVTGPTSKESMLCFNCTEVTHALNNKWYNLTNLV